MAEYLFSYGTLQPGLAPPEIEPMVQSFKPMGLAYIYGVLYDFGHYPGAVTGGAGKVWGQVFALPDDPCLLGQLDEYEEFDPSNIDESQFLRQKCLAMLENGNAMEVWVYVYNRNVESAAVIESGDFAKARDPKSSQP
jgi:gamma-glutamylcyclotransferase (GGCT)/AIG2-like uncharacterized protein YtfP